jgi:hypothetical protein
LPGGISPGNGTDGSVELMDSGFSCCDLYDRASGGDYMAFNR